MATRTWVGGASKVVQVQTLTISSNTDTETFIVTAYHPSGSDAANGVQIVSDTASSDSTTTIADEIVRQWNLSTHPYANFVTASNVANVVTFTSDKAGVPFVIAKSGTGTHSLATTTANCGPWSFIAQNFAEGILPVVNDDVVITGNYDLLYELDQDGYEIDNLSIHNHTGRIGWPGMPLRVDIENTGVGVGKFIVDCPSGGPRYVYLGTSAISPVIINAGYINPIGLYLSTDTTSGAIVNTYIHAGNVGLAWNEGDEYTMTGTLNLLTPNVRVYMGPGCDLATYIQENGGWAHCMSDAALLKISLAGGGNFIEQIAGTISTYNNDGTQSLHIGTGAISAGTLLRGYSDFTQAIADRSVTLSYRDGTADFATIITTGTRTLLGKPGAGTGDGV